MPIRARESNGFGASAANSMRDPHFHGGSAPTNKSFRYMRRQPTMVQYDTDNEDTTVSNNNNKKNPRFASPS